jgi:UDP-N-acetylglucosamine 2-epimerase (non-hydrolysing)
MVVFGTRPEAIKLAPVIRAILQTSTEFQLQVCVTGQHRQMLDQVLEIFEIVPDFDLNLMTQGQDLSDIHAAVILSMKELFKLNRPDLVLVHGDTTTSMAASVAAFYAGIPVGHVEAGLRTYDFTAPFPEEFNRQIIGKIAALHFAPTQQSKENLIREQIAQSTIWVTGNTVVDALNLAVEKIRMEPGLQLRLETQLQNVLGFAFKANKFILITGHRRENFGDGFIEICESIRVLAKNNPGIQFVYPVHLNPNVQSPVHQFLEGLDNVKLIDPLDYLCFTLLLANCYLVLTDSGGIQEEAPSLGKPVLVMRDTTERPEAIMAGTVKLVGANRMRIVEEVTRLIEDDTYYQSMASAYNPYGDGTASHQIVEVLKRWF